MKIAALVPVYAKKKRADSIIRNLSIEAAGIQSKGSGLEAETILVIDGASNSDIDSLVEEARILPCVKVIQGRPHLGKAEALNRAIAECDAEELLFLDNDIDLPAGVPFFRLTERILEEHEIAELPKIGKGRSLTARVQSYEFLANVVSEGYLAEHGERCPSVNGAAFAVRREVFDSLGGFRRVLNEDMDFAARAFMAGARFGFDHAMTVPNDVPETVKAWYEQRKRWMISPALWSSAYMPSIIKYSFQHSNFYLESSSIFYPLPPLAAALGALGGWLLSLIPALSGVWRAPLIAAAGLLCYLAVQRYFHRKADYYGAYFEPLTFFLYSFIYLPVWGITALKGSLLVAMGKLPELDWKHDEAEDIRIISEEKKRAQAIRKEIKADIREKEEALPMVKSMEDLGLEIIEGPAKSLRLHLAAQNASLARQHAVNKRRFQQGFAPRGQRHAQQRKGPKA